MRRPSPLTLALTLVLAPSPVVAGCGGDSSAASPGSDAGGAGSEGGVTPDSGGQGDAGNDARQDAGHPLDAGNGAEAGSHEAGSNGDAGPDAFDPPYPRIASYRIGGSQHYDTSFQDWASKQALVIIGGNWEGWDNNGTRPREAVVSGIKARSTLHTKVLQYGICDNVDWVTPSNPTWKAQVDANNWYLYLMGTTGTKATNFYSANFWQTNSTEYVPSDSHGRKLEDAFAVFVDSFYRTGGTPLAAPSLDGHFHDNVLFVSRVDGDFDRNGTLDHAAAFSLAWRTGIRRYFDQLEAIDPSVIRFANLDDMLAIGITDPTNTAAAAPLDGILHGALMEGFAGTNWATETWAGWAKAMDECRFRMNITIAPHLAVCGHMNVAADGSDPTTSTPYQAMRYGLASVMLVGAYYAYSPSNAYPDDILYSFDELGGNAGGPAIGYLGYPTEPAPAAAWQHGVWRRAFDHGIALVNPKGNGAQTVDLGGTFKHITGGQNPSLNDGSAVTRVTLQDRDGLILLMP